MTQIDTILSFHKTRYIKHCFLFQSSQKWWPQVLLIESRLLSDNPNVSRWLPPIPYLMLFLLPKNAPPSLHQTDDKIFWWPLTTLHKGGTGGKVGGASWPELSCLHPGPMIFPDLAWSWWPWCSWLSWWHTPKIPTEQIPIGIRSVGKCSGYHHHHHHHLQTSERVVLSCFFSHKTRPFFCC